MQKSTDEFVSKVDAVVPLAGLAVLDVGCGNGERSAEIAARCATLVGLDPDADDIAEATKRRLPNAIFQMGSALNLPFDDQSFDAVFLVKSLHHVPPKSMNQAQDEAVRVVRSSGYVIFLELGEEGTFYEAQRLFACDGWEECEQKGAACAAIITHPRLELIQELPDEKWYRYDSVADFTEEMEPTEHLDEIEAFLRDHEQLTARRRIFITRPR